MDRENIKELINNSKTKLDLTVDDDQKSLYKLADALLDIPGLNLEELYNIARDKNTPLEFKIAVKLFESRKFLINNEQSYNLAIIFAMWGEQNRLLPKSDKNPNGEDSLRVKLDQLDWATKGSKIKWKLYAIDDGCPHNSGKIAAEMARSHKLSENVKILHLDDAVPQTEGPLAGLESAAGSLKGGAIILGAMEAIKDGVDMVITTDSDNSVHLGQIGLLLQKTNDKKCRVIFGDRKDPDAILVKQENRWGIGIKLLRHMQRMIGHAIFSKGILDTQAAFKLYKCDLLEKIIQQPTVFDFSYDTDWISATIALDEPFEKVPFAFIDSFSESASITQGPMTTWETLLKGLSKQVQKYKLPHNQLMGNILDEEIRSSTDLDLLINSLPPELENVADKDLGNPEIMSPEKVRLWIQNIKQQNQNE